MPDEDIPDFDDPGYEQWLSDELERIRELELHERSAIRRGELVTEEQLN